MKYLGLYGRLTDEEIEVFKKEWKNEYKQNNQDPIFTTWELYYEVCPFSMEVSNTSQLVSIQRDREFDDAISQTNLIDDFRAGKNLCDLISNNEV